MRNHVREATITLAGMLAIASGVFALWPSPGKIVSGAAAGAYAAPAPTQPPPSFRPNELSAGHPKGQ